VAVLAGIIIAGVTFAVADSNRLASHVGIDCHEGAASELEDHGDRLNLIERKTDVMDMRQQIILESVEQVREDQKEGFDKLEKLISGNRQQP